MEARPDQLHGRSLRIHIPRLEIKNLRIEKIFSPSCFSRKPLTLSAPQSEEPDRGDALNHVIQTNPQFQLIVEANEAIILMINSFVDFFIQYYCPGYKGELNPLILILKEIIFNSTNESESFTAKGYDELLVTLSKSIHQWVVESPDSEVYFFPKNVGRQFLYDPVYIQASENRLQNLTQVFLPEATQEWHRKQLQEEVDAINLYLDDKLFIISTTSKFQKFEIFYLLFLSFHVLSMSGFFFEIQIQDLDEILREEIKRGKPNSFILQFLPNDHTVINIIKTHFLTFFMTNSICMPAIRELKAAETSERGGSKRLHNKSRKNKYKNKYKHKYKKSRKNKHSHCKKHNSK